MVLGSNVMLANESPSLDQFRLHEVTPFPKKFRGTFCSNIGDFWATNGLLF